MRTKAILVSLLVAVLTGCSVDLPQSPSLAPDKPLTNHAILGVWRLDLDPVTVTATAVPTRTVEGHVDVTPFITPPKCTDCVILAVLQFSEEDGVLDLEATLRNPTDFLGCDVRAILRWETPAIWLANPDDYTMLFDDGGLKALNPFVAYATDVANREFLPSAMHSRPIYFRFSELGHFKEVTFVVEASYPDNCDEPYQIANQSAAGELVGSNPVTVRCDVFDWQGDVTEVTIDPAPLADGPISLEHSGGTLWTGELANVNEAPEGDYYLLIRAVSPGIQTDSLYDYLHVTASASPGEGLDTGPWPMLGHDASRTARSPYSGPSLKPHLVWDSTGEGVSWEANYAGASLSAAGRLYVASKSGVDCLELDGDPVWHTPPPFDNVYPPPQPLLTAAGAVIVCFSSLESNSDPQGIYAYSASNGEELWSTTSITFPADPTPRGFSVYDSPVLSEDGLLVAVAREHVVVALRASDGAQQWLWPNDPAAYQSILPGSYLDAWRGAPALSSDGKIVAVADWFENPRLLVVTDLGGNWTDIPLTTVQKVNCHPMVTEDDEVVLAGWTLSALEPRAAVEAFNLLGIPLWNYTDDVIRLLSGVAAIGPEGTLYFLDGSGVNETQFPYPYYAYVLALNPEGTLAWREPVFTRASAGALGVVHFRSGVSVGDDGNIYVAASWPHGILAANYISGVAAMDPDGDVIWTYGVEENKGLTLGYYGTPTVGADGKLYVTRYDRIQALDD